VTLLTEASHCIQNGGLMSCVTYHQTQFRNLTTSLAGELDHFVNENNWKIVYDEPAKVFKIVGCL
jgi:hypothetical protein